MGKRERIGIFGGSFDPLHNAHVELAVTARDHGRLDREYFVVAAHQPHKQVGAHASPEDRFAMVASAIGRLPGMAASRMEIDRSGPSYTVDTVREFGRLFPEAELFLVLGFDSLLDLPRWKNPAGIVARAMLLAARRPGAAPRVPAELKGHYELLPFEEHAVSSTGIRDLIAAGESADGLIPPEVARIIREKGIYRADHANSAR